MDFLCFLDAVEILAVKIYKLDVLTSVQNFLEHGLAYLKK
jgi:hypothetical protein